MLSNLLGKNAPNYLEGKGRRLDDASIFLLTFLMYMEYANWNKRWRVHRKGEIAKRTGLTDTRVKGAIKTLTDNGLVYWYHAKGYRVNLDLVLGEYEPDVPKNDGSEWSMLAFTALGDVFFDAQARKGKAGRISYQEKLLALSLVVVADEAGRVYGIDLERQGRKLGMTTKDVGECLEALHFRYGFVLSYMPTLSLEEGFDHEPCVVNLNLAHPWLEGKLGFYAYCQMHRAKVLVTKTDRENVPEGGRGTTVQLVREPWAFEGFKEAIQGCRYSRWINSCKDEWVRVKLRTGKDTVVGAENTDDTLAEEMPEIEKGRRQAPEDMKRLFAHWERKGVSFHKRCDELYANAFGACLHWAQVLLAGQQLDVDAIDDMRKQCLDKLEELPLLGQWCEYPQGSLKHHYLEMLREGTAWVVGRLLEEVSKALRVHPDYSAISTKKLEARLATYLVERQMMIDYGLGASRKARLTGVMLFRMERTWHKEVWCMDIPTDDYLESHLGKGEYTIYFEKVAIRSTAKNEGQDQARNEQNQVREQDRAQYMKTEPKKVPVCRHYKNSQEAVRALVSEMKGGVTSTCQAETAASKRKARSKSSVVLAGESNCWMDFIEHHAKKSMVTIST